MAELWLPMKLVVAQFCRPKDHESIEGAECVVRKCDPVFVPPPVSYEPECCTANRFIGVLLASR